MSTYWPSPNTTSDFLSPQRIVGGRGSSQQVATLLAESLGIDSGAIIVAIDDIVLKNGSANHILDSLTAAGYDVHTSSGFGSEPTDDVVDAEAAKGRSVGARAIIGIGGGSVLDSSKLLGLLIKNDGTVRDWLGPVASNVDVAPLILIPTTCGTGSEATRIAMVTVAGAKRASSCARFVPNIAIIDPDLVASLPGFVVAATGMDALAHAVESLMSTAHSPMSAHNALRAIELLIANLEAACGGDQESLGNCLWASHLAGQALNAGVVVGHSLAYCLSYEKPMAHGVSCALALPYTLAYNQNLNSELAGVLSMALTAGRSSSLVDAANEVLALVKRLGLPSNLDEAEVPVNVEANIVARCLSEYPRPTNPEPLSEGTLAILVEAMRRGDLTAAFTATAK
jgi:alcohol dehydrogenase class IV